MPEADNHPEEPITSKADAFALIEEAEAEAAEAEALAAAARARARAARLRREALALAEAAEDYGDAAAAAADVEAQDYDGAAHDYGDASPDEYDDEEYEQEYDEDYEQEYDQEYDEDSEAEAAKAPPTGWRHRVPSLPVIATAVAAVLVIGFTAASVYMLLQHRDATQRHQREAAFVGGAKHGVINMISLDFTKAKADVQRVIDSSTGQFRDEFQQRSKDFVSVVEQSKAITEGTVNSAAVESVAGNSAVVLVAATSRVTNSPPGKDEPPKIWRLRVTVAEEGGKYKMSKVEYVP